MKCAIPYIRRTNFLPDEKDRLEDLHNRIFENIYDSKIFRKYTYPSGTTVVLGKGSNSIARDNKIAKVIEDMGLPKGVVKIEQMGNPSNIGKVATVIINVLPLANPSKLIRSVPQAFERDLNFFNKDTALLEQERKELDNFTLEEDSPVIKTTDTIKPGVQELFEVNFELATIGTTEQYSQYLDTIFPDSKIKDIVYHGTNKKFNNFDKNFINKSFENLIFFFKNKKNAEEWSEKSELNIKKEDLIEDIVNLNTSMQEASIEDNILYGLTQHFTLKNKEELIKKNNDSFNKIIYLLDYLNLDINTLYDLSNFNIEEYRTLVRNSIKNSPIEKVINNNRVISSIINSKNPLILKESYDYYLGKETGKKFTRDVNNNIEKHDSLIAEEVTEYENDEIKNRDTQYAVKEPEQIHILGNKQDIEGFKNFINKPIVDNKGQGKLFQLNNITTALIEEEKQKFEKEGITLNQKNNIGIINKLLYRTITPATYNLKSILTKGMYSLFVGRSYEDFVKTLKVLADLDIPVPELFNKIDKEQYNKRDDAWALSNGLPQKHNTFKYVGKGFIRNGEIVFDVNGEDIYDFTNPVFDDVDINKVFKKGFAVDKGNYVMGSYGISIGRDETGYFMRYTDRWDLDVTNNFVQKVIDVTQKPFIVSGKLYKALTYDELGNPQIYYTSVSTNSDINNYIEFMAMMGTEEEVASDNTYNTSSYQTAATQKTINVIKELLTNLGISLEKVDTLVEEHGINGVAEFSDMIIKIQSGMENVALTEEFMHFVSVMIPDTMLEELMSNIESYKIYKLVYNQYKEHPAYQNEDGSPNVNKIKLETVGKLLAEYYIMKAEGLTPEEVNIAKTLWSKIKDWLRNLFTGTSVNPFADLIDKLNSGELSLDQEHITRYDKLLQLTEANAQKIINFLQKDFEKSDLNKYNLNIEKINNFIDLIKTFKEEDLNYILNNASNVRVQREVFAQSKFYIQDIQNVDTLKEMLTNAVNYMRSSYNATVTLNNRIKNIKQELSEIDSKEYNEIRYRNQELVNIQKILQTYQEEFDDLFALFSDTDSGEMLDFIKETIGEIKSGIMSTEALLKSQAYEQIRKELEGENGKLTNIKRKYQADIDNLTQQLEAATSTRMKDLISAKIEALENAIKNPPLSFKQIVDLLETGDDNNTGVLRLVDGPLTSSNEVIQLISNQLVDVLNEVQREFSEELRNLKEIFQGRRQNVSDTAYDKFIHENKKYKFVEETGDLVETFQLELLNSIDQTSFENDIEILKYLKTLPFSTAIARYNELIGDKFTNEKFTEDNQEEFISDLLRNLFNNHAEDKYTEEYRQIFDILNQTLSDGKTVKEVRSKLYEQSNRAKNMLDSVVGTDDFDLGMEVVRSFEKEILELELFFTRDGNKKEGDALLIAETIAKFNQAKKEAKEAGRPIYIQFITNTAKINWEQQKAKIDEKYQTAFNNKENDSDTYEKVLKERNDWYALNVTVKEDPMFIEERNEIFAVIGDVLKQYNNPEFDEINKEIADIRKVLSSVVRRNTIEGTVNGNNATEEEQLFVKQQEEQLNYLKRFIKERKENLTKEDYELISELFEQLAQIQVEGVTDHWLQALESLGTNNTPQQLYANQWVKNNTIDVTDNYINEEIPEGFLAFKLNGEMRVFAPTVLWRNTLPVEEVYRNSRSVEPSFKWMSSKVNEIYENEKSITKNRKVKQSSPLYSNLKYGQLSSDEIVFLERLRNTYYNDQLLLPLSMRMGDVLPFMQKVGLQKTLKGISNIFKADTYKKLSRENFLGKEFREETLGEGKEDKGRKTDISSYSYKFKYGADNKDMLSQERDLYKLIGAYKYESIKYNRMKMLLPELNSIRKVIVKSLAKSKNNANLLKDLDVFVESYVNNKVAKESGMLASVIRKFNNKMRQFTSHLYLYMPWLYTGSIKSFLASMYSAYANHSILKGFTKGSLKKGYIKAGQTAIDFTYNEHKLIPSKRTAILKRLQVFQESNFRADLDANTDLMLKMANNAGYISSLGHRQFAERYVTFAMFEMYNDNLEKDIEEYYEYDKKTGTLILKDESLDENKLSRDVRDMAQFSIGNYNSLNNPIAKHTIIGSTMFFFGNHIINGLITRLSGRTTRSGVEIKPYMAFWKPDVRKIYLELFKGLMSTDALTILNHKHLTATEKDMLFRFYKDFLLTNALGAAYYLVSKAMQESGDDDDELSWYALMVFRKAYSEMSYFNPVEKVGIPVRLVTDTEFSYKGNTIEKTYNYLIGKKAVEMLTPSIFPGDYRGLRFSTEDIKTKDPYYKQYKDNLLLYNFHRYTRTKGFFDYKYGKQSLKGFEYFDKSVFQYEEN